MAVDVNVCRSISDLRKWGHLSPHLCIEFEWKPEYANEVAKFANVRTVSFSQGARVSSFAMLEQLTSVEAIHAIGQHELVDISSLVNMPWLRRLWLSAVWQLDISPLAKMPFLHELKLGDARSGYRWLAGLTGLVRLEIWGLRLSSLTHLEGLTNLEELHAHSMPLRSLAGLPTKSPIRGLDVRDTTLRAIDGIQGIPTLQALWLFGCKKLESVAPVSQCVNLRELYLNDVQCPIDLSTFLPCQELETLYFYDANVTPNSFSALRQFRALRTCQFTRYAFQTDQEIDALLRDMPCCKFRIVQPGGVIET